MIMCREWKEYQKKPKIIKQKRHWDSQELKKLKWGIDKR